MEKGSIDDKSLTGRQLKSMDQSNELSSNQLIVSNLSTSAMTNEKSFHLQNNRTPDNSNVIKSHLNKTNGTSSQTPKRRSHRELGNRGYIKKMRKIPFLGILCAIMYAFFMSTSVALLKIVPNLHPIAVLIYRCIIQAGIFFIIAINNQKSLFGIFGERYPLAGRATSGMMNQLCWYTSIRYMSLTDSSAIYYSAPAFVAVLAFFMLGEKFGIYECSSVIITLIGVTLVSKPGFLPFFRPESSTDSQLTSNDSVILRPILSINLTANSSLTTQTDYIIQTENYHVYGMILAFIGAITFALSNIYVRQMVKTSTEITAFWFGMVTIIVCFPLAFTLNVMTLPAGLLEWSVVIIVGVFAVLGQIAFTLALKIVRATNDPRPSEHMDEQTSHLPRIRRQILGTGAYIKRNENYESAEVNEPEVNNGNQKKSRPFATLGFKPWGGKRSMPTKLHNVYLTETDLPLAKRVKTEKTFRSLGGKRDREMIVQNEFKAKLLNEYLKRLEALNTLTCEFFESQNDE